jgi:putative glycerol-1-phosphate prenyltransferase
MEVFDRIEKNTIEGKKQLAILIDPDKSTRASLRETASIAGQSGADYLFVGGSLLTRDNMKLCIDELKSVCGLPVIIFPGNILQVVDNADALLLLSLISGRNPEMLIGNHVVAAPLIRNSGLEVIPTGYILVESGKITSVLYMSNTLPIPFDKTDIAVCTAMAGEMLGLQLIFMDAGSGAIQNIPMEMVRAVRQNIQVPLVVGGGIRTPEAALEVWDAGADVVVIGNAAETHPDVILEMGEARKAINE